MVRPFSELCGALSHLLTPSDLKSENIFIQETEGGIVCAIGDLDTAKIISSSSKAKTVIGTPAFIAPEVLESMNENVYTSKVDSTYLPRLFFASSHTKFSFLLWNDHL